jgi:hypothetical protein
MHMAEKQMLNKTEQKTKQNSEPLPITLLPSLSSFISTKPAFVIIRRLSALRLPHGQVILIHDSRRVLGIQQRRLGIRVPVSHSTTHMHVALFRLFKCLFVRNGSGAGHGALVDYVAKGETDAAADEHARPVDCLVAQTHVVAFFDEDG